MTAPPIGDPLEVLRVATTRLTEAGFTYMLTGPLALRAYGDWPLLRVADLIVPMRTADAEWIAALFSRDFDFDPTALERALSDERLATLTHRDTGVRLRCHALVADPYGRQAFERRRTAALDGIPVSVAAPEDVVLWLLREDAEQRGAVSEDARLLLAQFSDLDDSYLEKWGAHLRVADRLEAARH
jgi:hypothetical protein